LVADVEMAATIENMEGGRVSQSFLISLYILTTALIPCLTRCGKMGIFNAETRIKAIEQGVDSEGIEIIQDPQEIQKLAFGLMQKATEEILIMYSTANAFHRQEYAGAFQLLKGPAAERGVKIRILTPGDELILETEQNLMIVQKKSRQPNGAISIRYIQPHLQTEASIMIVDKKYSLAIEAIKG